MNIKTGRSQRYKPEGGYCEIQARYMWNIGGIARKIHARGGLIIKLLYNYIYNNNKIIKY